MDLRLLVAFCALCLPLAAECGGAKHGEGGDSKPAQDNLPAPQHVSSAIGGVFPIGTSSTRHSDEGASGGTSGSAQGSTVDRTERGTGVWVQKLNNFLDLLKKITADPDGFVGLMEKARRQRTKTLRKVLVITIHSADIILRRDRIARFWDGFAEMEWLAQKAVTKFEEALNEKHSALRQGMPQQSAVGSAQSMNPSDEGVSDSPDEIRSILKILDEFLARQDVWFHTVAAKLSHTSMQKYLTIATAILPSISEMMIDLKEEDAILEGKAQGAFDKARDALS